jgi:hypothetical protein
MARICLTRHLFLPAHRQRHTGRAATGYSLTAAAPGPAGHWHPRPAAACQPGSDGCPGRGPGQLPPSLESAGRSCHERLTGPTACSGYSVAPVRHQPRSPARPPAGTGVDDPARPGLAGPPGPGLPCAKTTDTIPSPIIRSDFDWHSAPGRGRRSRGTAAIDRPSPTRSPRLACPAEIVTPSHRRDSHRVRPGRPTTTEARQGRARRPGRVLSGRFAGLSVIEFFVTMLVKYRVRWVLLFLMMFSPQFLVEPMAVNKTKNSGIQVLLYLTFC